VSFFFTNEQNMVSVFDKTFAGSAVRVRLAPPARFENITAGQINLRL
jgi:hypothetical protein